MRVRASGGGRKASVAAKLGRIVARVSDHDADVPSPVEILGDRVDFLEWTLGEYVERVDVLATRAAREPRAAPHSGARPLGSTDPKAGAEGGAGRMSPAAHTREESARENAARPDPVGRDAASDPDAPVIGAIVEPSPERMTRPVASPKPVHQGDGEAGLVAAIASLERRQDAAAAALTARLERIEAVLVHDAMTAGDGERNGEGEAASTSRETPGLAEALAPISDAQARVLSELGAHGATLDALVRAMQPERLAIRLAERLQADAPGPPSAPPTRPGQEMRLDRIEKRIALNAARIERASATLTAAAGPHPRAAGAARRDGAEAWADRILASLTELRTELGAGSSRPCETDGRLRLVFAEILARAMRAERSARMSPEDRENGGMYPSKY
jgi:hypothetical protein